MNLLYIYSLYSLHIFIWGCIHNLHLVDLLKFSRSALKQEITGQGDIEKLYVNDYINRNRNNKNQLLFSNIA